MTSPEQQKDHHQRDQPPFLLLPEEEKKFFAQPEHCECCKVPCVQMPAEIPAANHLLCPFAHSSNAAGAEHTTDPSARRASISRAASPVIVALQREGEQELEFWLARKRGNDFPYSRAANFGCFISVQNPPKFRCNCQSPGACFRAVRYVRAQRFRVVLSQRLSPLVEQGVRGLAAGRSCPSWSRNGGCMVKSAMACSTLHSSHGVNARRSAHSAREGTGLVVFPHPVAAATPGRTAFASK